MKKGKFIRIDYSMLSSYMGRSATVIVFALIVALALGALFLEENDMAHVPITIGVCALDSIRSWDALESLADLAREKGAGDISWRYLEEDAPPTGCDFYLMTSVQGAPYIAEGSLTCALIATVKQGVRYAHGGIIAPSGVDPDVLSDGTVLFTSPVSAAGYLSPYTALAAAGYTVAGPARFAFAGPYMSEERVIFGVLFGAYDAGGIGLERLHYLEQLGIVPDGSLTVLLEGDPMPEMIIVVEPAVEPRKRRGFCERLPLILEKMPRFLEADLAGIGIAGFVVPREEDIALLKSIPGRLPDHSFAPALRR